MQLKSMTEMRYLSWDTIFKVRPEDDAIYWQLLAFKCYLCTSHLKTTSGNQVINWKLVPILISVFLKRQNFFAKAASVPVFILGLGLHDIGKNFVIVYMHLFFNCVMLRGFEYLLDLHVILCFLEKLHQKNWDIKYLSAAAAAMLLAWWVCSTRFLFFLGVLYFIYDFFNDSCIRNLKVWHVAFSFCMLMIRTFN
ncbi:hypothetical protein JTE90_021324 [Oedothorax gibbosus]|uniref:Uncharacterized protein n=1 Tax=Oedothorax gibbosus TaxID=931172 RepID=A0AAV6VLS7_9ARAC|nr:hypothetical protein JTE90_021324 [Oedothorax gibbosus]